VTISVRGPTSPEVVVDGSRVPSASLGVKRPVNPGNHAVKVSAEGFGPAEKSFSLSEGQATSVSLELTPLPAASRPALAPTMEETTGGPDQAAPRSSRRVPAYIAFGLGGAGLVAGVVSGFVAWGKYKKLEDVCPDHTCNDNYEADVRSYHTVGVASAIGFVVAGVGGGVGLALMLTEPKSTENQRAAQVSPYVGLGGVGLRGAF
jgi:hypothetical protein